MLNQRIKSFKHAFDGISAFFKSETHAKIHLFAAIIVVLLGFILDINQTEWCLLLLCIALVLVSEAFNTAIERLADSVTTEFNPLIKISKDVAAGAVLLASIFALVIGLIIFYPKVYDLFL